MGLWLEDFLHKWNPLLQNIQQNHKCVLNSVLKTLCLVLWVLYVYNSTKAGFIVNLCLKWNRIDDFGLETKVLFEAYPGIYPSWELC